MRCDVYSATRCGGAASTFIVRRYHKPVNDACARTVISCGVDCSTRRTSKPRASVVDSRLPVCAVNEPCPAR